MTSPNRYRILTISLEGKAIGVLCLRALLGLMPCLTTNEASALTDVSASASASAKVASRTPVEAPNS